MTYGVSRIMIAVRLRSNSNQSIYLLYLVDVILKQDKQQSSTFAYCAKANVIPEDEDIFGMKAASFVICFTDTYGNIPTLGGISLYG